MIVVTGGTGLIGSELLRLLSQAGVPARALTRNPNKAQKLPSITWVVGDLARAETLTTAFEGAKTLFLLTHYYEDMVELQLNAIAAASAAGVTHVVKVSAFAASDHSNAPIGRWHHRVEKELQASGMGWTMLRPHHFMQNLLPKPGTSFRRASSTRPRVTAKFLTSMHVTLPQSLLSRSPSRGISARSTR